MACLPHLLPLVPSQNLLTLNNLLTKTNINVYLKYLHLFGSFDVQYKASAQNDTDDYKLQTNDIVVVFTLQLI